MLYLAQYIFQYEIQISMCVFKLPQSHEQSTDRINILCLIEIIPIDDLF